MKWMWITLLVIGFSVSKVNADVGCYLNGSDRFYTSPTGTMVGTPTGYNYNNNSSYFDQCKPANNPTNCPCAMPVSNRSEVCYVGGAGGTRGSRWNFTQYDNCDLDDNAIWLLVLTGVASVVYLRKQPLWV